MRRKAMPPAPDTRAPWQVAQAAGCACRGSDELCPCQNVDEPWEYGRGGERPPTTEERLRGALKSVQGWDALYDAFPDGLARQVREALSGDAPTTGRALWQENEDLRRELYRANETLRQAAIAKATGQQP